MGVLLGHASENGFLGFGILINQILCFSVREIKSNDFVPCGYDEMVVAA